MANVKCLRDLRAPIAVGLIIVAVAAPMNAQFGMPLLKNKTTLQRKLPALVHLPGTSVRLVVMGHAGATDLVQDFKAMLGSELLKDDPRMRIEEEGADSTINCQILAFEHPPATTSTRPGTPTGKGTPKPVTYTRVTGIMRVSFQARAKNGGTVGGDNIIAKYDEEFDTSGNAVSGGLMGSMKNSINRVKGGAKSEDMNPPTAAELQSKLMTSAVQQIVMQVVNTRELVEVMLAKGKGLDQGVKDAEGGLWSRALEEWGAAPPQPRPVDDAYRLYDLGVAYEAMAYAAEDNKAAVKFLDQASINYGKAIDSNPAEKYFREPQKRIETALAHYEKLEAEEKKTAAAKAAAEKEAADKAAADKAAADKAAADQAAAAAAPAAKTPAKTTTRKKGK